MNLPQPVTSDQQFMAATCELLAKQNDLLAEIRDRLAERSNNGEPVAAHGDHPDGAVELKEPAVPPAVAPIDGAGTDEPAAPKRTARKSATKRTSAAQRRTTKETS